MAKKEKVKQPVVKMQEEQYDYFLTCTSDELETWYKSYRVGYPRHVAPMIRALATARGIDTTEWEDFYV